MIITEKSTGSDAASSKLMHCVVCEKCRADAGQGDTQARAVLAAMETGWKFRPHPRLSLPRLIGLADLASAEFFCPRCQ